MDLVKRLRCDADEYVMKYGDSLLTEAADEIERLQGELEKSNKYADHLGMSLRDVKRERDELQKRISDYRDTTSGCPDVLVSRALLATMVPATELAAVTQDHSEWKSNARHYIEALEEQLAAVTKERDEFDTYKIAMANAALQAELATVTRERDEWKRNHEAETIASDRLYEQLATVTRERDELKEICNGKKP